MVLSQCACDSVIFLSHFFTRESKFVNAFQFGKIKKNVVKKNTGLNILKIDLTDMNYGRI